VSVRIKWEPVLNVRQDTQYPRLFHSLHPVPGSPKEIAVPGSPSEGPALSEDWTGATSIRGNLCQAFPILSTLKITGLNQSVQPVMRVPRCFIPGMSPP
jgi:hypothetical protein